MGELRHVAICVRAPEQVIGFYRDADRLRVVWRPAHGRASVSSGGRQHYELLLVAAPAVGDVGSPRQRPYRTAWQVGEGVTALRQAQPRLEAPRIAIDGAANHGVRLSLCLIEWEGK